jgi:hypothetical protein
MSQRASLLTERWTPLRHHAEQQRFWKSQARFQVVPAGRRSGKTELAKRKILFLAMKAAGLSPNFFFGAPTRDQAKRIFWKDLKAMVHPDIMLDKSETELSITIANGATLWVVGMDKPQRIEGTPWDGGVLDEYANMKPGAWPENVRPALEDRGGFCIFTGVPEGRNHYYDMYRMAGTREGWDRFRWKSAEILPAAVVEAARLDLDPMTFAQEYEADFLNFEGRAYYPFTEDLHCAKLADRYNINGDLILCFDFNVNPGTATVAQEMDFPVRLAPPKPVEIGGAVLFAGEIASEEHGTGVIGEIHIPNNSNTPAVVRKFIADWGNHEGRIFVYGDATGGSRKTSATEGNDWDLVRNGLYGHFGNEQIHMRVPRANPSERSRVNAVNTRLKSGNDAIHLMVDPVAAPELVRDFEGVRLLAGGSGEIDKKHDPKLTHLSDGLGYYISKEYPVRKSAMSSEVLYL